MKRDYTPNVVCFGEILWDVLPDVRKPGGAPMNVAYHLNKLGIAVDLLSSVGHDQAGDDLISFLKSGGLSAELVQRSSDYNTSEVLARITEDHEVTYDIVKPVAWDQITYTTEMKQAVSQADAIVFGSLSAREPVTRDTLYSLIESARYRVFDVNLRAPHYSDDVIINLLQRADMVKLNLSELLLIIRWLSPAIIKNEMQAVELLFSWFQIQEVLITKGRKGATYYSREIRYDYPTYAIEVADTIGSGDAFLAAFLAMKLNNEPLEVTLDYAAAMGAFITSQSGACPDYSRFDFERFIWKKKYPQYGLAS
ncbi:carbohydrate kinase family protein [Mucilaginibacter terrae]|uniref:Fructokinase n=1 Tax=Mucilaginibacter terrae TaxID=1955052 RepID=A0ABU3GX09_9SPHI|nr:carbohydrate kinase [Mucilaginibacter terrae]MDT3404299.1 fructokinase [Mucilaginibacter terrae]